MTHAVSLRWPELKVVPVKAHIKESTQGLRHNLGASFIRKRVQSKGRDIRGRPICNSPHVNRGGNALSLQTSFVDFSGLVLLLVVMVVAQNVLLMKRHFSVHGYEHFKLLGSITMSDFVAGIIIFHIDTFFFYLIIKSHQADSSWLFGSIFSEGDDDSDNDGERSALSNRISVHGGALNTISWHMTRPDAALTQSTALVLMQKRRSIGTFKRREAKRNSIVARKRLRDDQKLLMIGPLLIGICTTAIATVMNHYIITRLVSSWLIRIGYCMGNVIFALKMASFCHTCYDVGKALLSGCDLTLLGGTVEEALFLSCHQRVGTAINVQEAFRFLFYPTLCYQFIYPRNERINTSKVVMHCGLLLMCYTLFQFFSSQFILPSIGRFYESAEYRSSRSLMNLVLQHIRLSLSICVPTVLAWLTFFVAIFQNGLSLIGELLRFGDRRFYDDWWNSDNLSIYWRKWNRPVHNFASRHIYKPMVSRNIPPVISALIVFLASAALHEYVVVVTWRLPWSGFIMAAFVGQIPLMLIRFHPWWKGNVFFWLTFCFSGQTLMLQYIYYMYHVTHSGGLAFHISDKLEILVASDLLQCARNVTM